MDNGYFDFKLTGDQKTKIALCEAQNWRCCYCKFSVVFIPGETNRQNAATFEHVKPLSKGGEDKLYNLVIACMLCNNTRSSRNPTRFERIIQKLLLKEEIRDSWHKFSPELIRLLAIEVDYGYTQEKAERGNPSKMRRIKVLDYRRGLLLKNILESSHI